MHYSPAVPTGVLRRAGFPEGAAGGPSISVSIVLCCLLVGCEGTACNNIPDVPRGRNCVTHTRACFCLAAPRSSTGHRNGNLLPPPPRAPQFESVSAAALVVFTVLLKSTCGLLVNYHLSRGFSLSNRGQSE